MIQELRNYQCMPGKLQLVLNRIRGTSLPLFEKLKIRAGPIHTVSVGESHLDIIYIVDWESLDERDAKWKLLRDSPEWIAATEPELKDGPWIRNVRTQILKRAF